jgi:hypothetical protein
MAVRVNVAVAVRAVGPVLVGMAVLVSVTGALGFGIDGGHLGSRYCLTLA